MKLLRTIIGKTKLDRKRSQQIKESCSIEWMKELGEENGTNM